MITEADPTPGPLQTRSQGSYHCADISCPVISFLPVLSGEMVQPLNSSFNSLWSLHTVFQDGDGLHICSQRVRAPLSLILSGPYLCHCCRRHWRAFETMTPCRAPCLSLVIGCAAHHGKHIRTLSYFPLGNY